MLVRRADEPHRNLRPSQQIGLTRLRRRDVEPPQLRDDRTHNSPLLLQRMHVPQQQIKTQTAHHHNKHPHRTAEKQSNATARSEAMMSDPTA